MPHVDLAGATHAGKVRKSNQDAYGLHPDLGLAVVADGVGGAPCGEVAAALAVESVAASFREWRFQDAEEAVRAAVLHAARTVREAGVKNAACKGMASTLVMAHWRGPRFWIANVGDSRAYRFRGGELTQLSYDQNVANELRTLFGLGDDQVKNLPHRNSLTMSIGRAADPVVRIHGEVFEDGDLLLLCTDGLSGPASHAAMHAIVATTDDPREMVEHLIDRALAAGGPDNITAVVARYRA